MSSRVTLKVSIFLNLKYLKIEFLEIWFIVLFKCSHLNRINKNDSMSVSSMSAMMSCNRLKECTTSRGNMSLNVLPFLCRALI